jgi:fucose 4-O-acetylase-like acetyltransferase
VAAQEPSPGARAFRIVATVLGVALLALTVPFAIIATESDDPTQTIHRFHATGGAVPSLILAAALFVLAWRPGAVAAMQLFVAGAIVSLLVGLIAGDLFTGLLFLGVVLAAILLALYPNRGEVRRTGGPRLSLVAVAVLAFVPAIAYALAQASLQRHGTSLDPHADMHHYSGAAVAAVSLPATVLVAGIGRAAWRIVGWIGAAALVLFGVSGLAFSDYVSAPDPAWCWASVATAVVVFALTESEARRMPGGRTA